MKIVKIFRLHTIILLFSIYPFVLPAQNHDLQKIRSQIIRKPDTTTISKYVKTLNSESRTLSNDTLFDGYEIAYSASKKIKFNKGAGLAAFYIGNLHNSTGKYNLALSYLLEAEKRFEKINDPQLLATVYNAIGNTYYGNSNLSEMKRYFTLCYELAKKHDMENYEAYGAGGLANCYLGNKDYNTSTRYFEIAAGLFKRVGNILGETICYINIAGNYVLQENAPLAKKSLERAREAVIDLNFNYASYLYFGTEGNIAELNGDYDAAEYHYNRALEFSKISQASHNISEIYLNLYEVSYKKGEYKKSADYLKLHQQYKDSVFNEKNNQLLLDVKEKYESEKKDSEIQLLNQQNDLATLELNQKRMLIYFGVGGISIMLIFLFFVVRSNINRRKSNQLLAAQKVIIETKQKEIVDSINYAKRIQFTLLAQSELMQKIWPEHFVFFKPKDIVSGDFYWINQKDNYVFLAVCDCTGHGVPGAFMSLLSINYLNEAVIEKDLLRPNEIFDHVRNRLIESVSKEGQRDGFDGILLRFDTVSKTLCYASANNSPVLVENGILKSQPKDKMPVGLGEAKEPFRLFEIPYISGGMLYLYTDGYVDQFGGEKGKKLKTPYFHALLKTMTPHSTDRQAEILMQHFHTWKGDCEQVDDICVIGLKLD